MQSRANIRTDASKTQWRRARMSVKGQPIHIRDLLPIQIYHFRHTHTTHQKCHDSPLAIFWTPSLPPVEETAPLGDEVAGDVGEEAKQSRIIRTSLLLIIMLSTSRRISRLTVSTTRWRLLPKGAHTFVGSFRLLSTRIRSFILRPR